jgi:hypothetical protein
MDLVVTTPGVKTTPLRAALDPSPQAALLVFDRSTRCGSTTVDPTLAVRIRLAVAPCAVSLHAADRVRRRLAATGQSVDSVVVSCDRLGSNIRNWLSDRFGCPVSVQPVDRCLKRRSALEYYE